jgi:hypothetical protein
MLVEPKFRYFKLLTHRDAKQTYSHLNTRNPHERSVGAVGLFNPVICTEGKCKAKEVLEHH